MTLVYLSRHMFRVTQTMIENSEQQKTGSKNRIEIPMFLACTISQLPKPTPPPSRQIGLPGMDWVIPSRRSSSMGSLLSTSLSSISNVSRSPTMVRLLKISSKSFRICDNLMNQTQFEHKYYK